MARPTLTVAELAYALGIIGETTATIPADRTAQLTRLLAVATALVLAEAPGAPAEVQNEAVIRLAGWMVDSDPSRANASQNPITSSGAGPILAPFRTVTLGLPGATRPANYPDVPDEPGLFALEADGPSNEIAWIPLLQFLEEELYRELTDGQVPVVGHFLRIASVDSDEDRVTIDSAEVKGGGDKPDGGWTIADLAAAVVARLVPAYSSADGGDLVAVKSDGSALEFVDPGGGSGRVNNIGSLTTASGVVTLGFTRGGVKRTVTLSKTDLATAIENAISGIKSIDSLTQSSGALTLRSTDLLNTSHPLTLAKADVLAMILAAAGTRMAPALAGNGGKFLAVNSGATAVELVDKPSGGKPSGGWPLADLADDARNRMAPRTLGVGNADKFLAVNDDGTAVVLVDKPSGGGTPDDGSVTVAKLAADALARMSPDPSGNAGKFLAINQGGQAVTLVDAPGGGGGGAADGAFETIYSWDENTAAEKTQLDNGYCLSPVLDADAIAHLKTFQMLFVRMGRANDSQMMFGPIPVEQFGDFGTTSQVFFLLPQPTWWYGGYRPDERSTGFVGDISVAKEVSPSVRLHVAFSNMDRATYSNVPPLVEIVGYRAASGGGGGGSGNPLTTLQFGQQSGGLSLAATLKDSTVVQAIMDASTWLSVLTADANVQDVTKAGSRFIPLVSESTEASGTKRTTTLGFDYAFADDGTPAIIIDGAGPDKSDGTGREDLIVRRSTNKTPVLIRPKTFAITAEKTLKLTAESSDPDTGNAGAVWETGVLSGLFAEAKAVGPAFSMTSARSGSLSADHAAPIVAQFGSAITLRLMILPSNPALEGAVFAWADFPAHLLSVPANDAHYITLFGQTQYSAINNANGDIASDSTIQSLHVRLQYSTDNGLQIMLQAALHRSWVFEGVQPKFQFYAIR